MGVITPIAGTALSSAEVPVLPAPSSAIPERFPPGWLWQQEYSGGDTIKEHIAASEDDLRARLIASPWLDSVSAYISTNPNESAVDKAERVITTALASARLDINQWAVEARAGAIRESTFTADKDEIVGRLAVWVRRSPVTVVEYRPTSRFRVELVANGRGGCYLRSASPILPQSPRATASRGAQRLRRRAHR